MLRVKNKLKNKILRDKMQHVLSALRAGNTIIDIWFNNNMMR